MKDILPKGETTISSKAITNPAWKEPPQKPCDLRTSKAGDPWHIGFTIGNSPKKRTNLSFNDLEPKH